MKEFIIGSCLAFWIISLTLSAVNITFLFIALVFPLLVIGIAYNLHLVKEIKKRVNMH